jgi:hypothetical protein
VSKKTNQKKKVNIKLEPGQSFLIEDLDLLIHVQKTYVNMLRGQISAEDKSACNRVIAAVNLAIENVHNSTSSDYGDEW